MGENKALVEFDGQTFLQNIESSVLGGGCSKVHLVLGPPHGDEIGKRRPELSTFWNPHPEGGMLSSLQVGLRALGREPSISAVIVALIDHPGVRASTVAALIEAHDRSMDQVIRPRFQGRHGHPFLIARSAFGALLDAPLSGGPRPVIRRLRPSSSLDVQDPAILRDIDTPARLRALEPADAPPL